jgi:hypothetical protein
VNTFEFLCTAALVTTGVVLVGALLTTAGLVGTSALLAVL